MLKSPNEAQYYSWGGALFRILSDCSEILWIAEQEKWGPVQVVRAAEEQRVTPLYVGLKWPGAIYG